jgi:hemerythrin-like domain-containing protein
MMIDVIEKILIGHRDISEKKDFMDRFLRARGDERDPGAAAKSIASFFQNEVREHIRLEEQILFPVVRAAVADEATEMIGQLEYEHKRIQREIDELLRLLAEPVSGLPGLQEHVAASIVRLLEEVLAHAKREDNELFSWVRNNFGTKEQADLERRYFSYIRATPDDLR